MGRTSEFFDGEAFTQGPELPDDFGIVCAVEYEPMKVFVTSDVTPWIADFTQDDEEPEWTQVWFLHLHEPDNTI